METTINMIKQMLDKLQKFEKSKGREPNDMREFVIWLNEALFNQHHTEDPSHDNHLDMEITFLLIMQNKYYKMYCKKALHNSQINSPDEYSFLYHLNLVDSFRKMELITIHLLEAPSGIEVIKRLLKKKLIEEFDDKDDKRAKRIRITPNGKKEIEMLIPEMNKVYIKMTAEMPLKEKLHVLSFLNKLNDYHSQSTELIK